jgi:hypothetical protein
MCECTPPRGRPVDGRLCMRGRGGLGACVCVWWWWWGWRRRAAGAAALPTTRTGPLPTPYPPPQVADGGRGVGGQGHARHGCHGQHAEHGGHGHHQHGQHAEHSKNGLHCHHQHHCEQQAQNACARQEQALHHGGAQEAQHGPQHADVAHEEGALEPPVEALQHMAQDLQQPEEWGQATEEEWHLWERQHASTAQQAQQATAEQQWVAFSRRCSSLLLPSCGGRWLIT